MQRLVIDLDPDLAPALHGIAGVDGQIQQRIFKIRLVNLNHAQWLGQLQLEIHLRAHGIEQQLLHILHQRPRIGRLAALRLAAAERRQLRGQPVGALDGFLNHLQIALRLLIGQAFFEQIAVQIDDKQQIVQIVRHAASNALQQLSFLRLGQLLLHGPRALQVGLIVLANLLTLQRLPQLALLESLNIDAGAHDVVKLPIFIQHQLRPGLKPLQIALVVVQPKIHAIAALVQHELQKPGIGARDVAGVNRLNPAPIGQIGVAVRAIEIVPQRLAEPEHLTIGAAQPDMGRNPGNAVHHLFGQGRGIFGQRPLQPAQPLQGKTLHRPQIALIEQRRKLQPEAQIRVHTMNGGLLLHALAYGRAGAGIVRQKTGTLTEFTQHMGGQHLLERRVHELNAQRFLIDQGKGRGALTHALGDGGNQVLLVHGWWGLSCKPGKFPVLARGQPTESARQPSLVTGLVPLCLHLWQCAVGLFRQLS